MRSPRRIITAAVLGAALVAGLLVARDDAPEPAPRAGEAPATETEQPRSKGLAEEAEEREEVLEGRLEALEEAVDAGSFGARQPIPHVSTRGWVGERVVDPAYDDWEPAIAADPNAPYVYILTTRYGGPVACKNACPSPNIIIEISRDNGKTWSHGKFLCRCRRNQGQYDPLIEIVPKTGHVYAAWMNDFDVVFSKSTDHGRTWTDPVPIYGKVGWSDKPVLITSNNGRDVYIAFNKSHNFIAQSHDYGETWGRNPIKTNDDRRYYFAGAGHVAPDGTATFALLSQDYSGPDAYDNVQYHAVTSTDRGRTWRTWLVDTGPQSSPCISEGCYQDFYQAVPGLAGDEDGDLVFLYPLASEPDGPMRSYARRSTDRGKTWGPRVALSPAGANSTYPTGVGTGNGDIRAWYMDDRNERENAWNVWYRSSSDGGRTWSREVRLSDATGGADYKSPDGFLEPYGDYGEIAITSRGKTIAVWGEGFSFFGPGGAWYNRER